MAYLRDTTVYERENLGYFIIQEHSDLALTEKQHMFLLLSFILRVVKGGKVAWCPLLSDA